MTHTFRSRDEIMLAAGSFPPDFSDAFILEVLLDQRSLLQEIRDAVVKPPITIGGECIACRASTSGLCNTHETQMEQKVYAVPEKDELFDEVVSVIKTMAKGREVTTQGIRNRFEMTYGKASALIDQLEREGIITKKDKDGRRYVV
jgi:DNA segregation ATPase FtsK/SpoIIIE-like protein